MLNHKNPESRKPVKLTELPLPSLANTLRFINKAKGRKLNIISNAVQLRCLEENSPEFSFGQFAFCNVLRFIASAGKSELKQILSVANERRADYGTF